MENCRKCLFPKKIKCWDCEELLIHKHGDKNVPHYSHKSGTSHGESWEHKLSKEILKIILFRYIININSICITCGGEWTNIINVVGENIYDILLEYRNQNEIYDLVVLSKENNSIVYIFEVFHTHKQKRNIENCFEIKTRFKPSGNSLIF
jgi:hypothetical protein